MASIKNYIYSIEQSRERDSEYSHLSFIIRPVMTRYSDLPVSQNTICAMTWQTSPDTPYWYGCSINQLPSSMDSRERWTELKMIVDSIYRAINEASAKDFTFNLTPENGVEILEGLGIRRGVYDPRTGWTEPIDTLLPPEIKRWDALSTGDGYKREYAWTHTYGTSEGEAKTDITIRVEQGDSYVKNSAVYTRWLKEGRPVKQALVGQPVVSTFGMACHCLRWPSPSAPEMPDSFFEPSGNMPTNVAAQELADSMGGGEPVVEYPVDGSIEAGEEDDARSTVSRLSNGDNWQGEH